MPSTNRTTALIKQGWVRAILLLIIYVSLSVAAGFFVSTTEWWITLSFLISLALVYFFRTFIDRKTFIGIGLERHRIFPHAVTGFFVGTLIVSSGTIIIFMLRNLEWIDIVPDMNTLFFNAVILLMVAAGEEMVFRGYLLRNLMKSMNRWGALTVSSLLFALVHLSNLNIPPLAIVNTFLGAILMGITYIHTRSLWTPLFLHFTWNFFQAPVYGFKVSGIEFTSLFVLHPKGSTNISGGEYGFEASAVCTVLLLIAIVLWVIIEQRRPASSKVYYLS